MNWQYLAPMLIAAGLTLVLIVSVTLLLLTGKRVPTEFYSLITGGFGFLAGGGVSVVRRR